jgi:Iap family predicted aminopeptidase
MTTTAKLLPDMSDDEINKIKAAYNTLAEIGGRCNWNYWLIDETHQKLGVMLAVLTARKLRVEPGNNGGGG